MLELKSQGVTFIVKGSKEEQRIRQEGRASIQKAIEQEKKPSFASRFFNVMSGV